MTDARPRLGAVRLPALPEILLQLLALYRRDDASISEFASLIAADPAMAAKVMAAANSAAYRSAEPVRDLPRCLNVLGTETVRTVVISQAIFQAMHSVPALRRVDLLSFWRHSLLTSAVARELARRMPGVQEDEAYLAGLLHDIGRLGLLAAAPEFHAEGLSPDDDPARCAIERRWLKVDHAEAGSWLVGRWRLSRELADSVRYHHEPLPRLVNTDRLIRVVALAHLIAQESPDVKLVAEGAAICGLDFAQVSEATETANAKLIGTAAQLGISLDASGVAQRSSTAAEQIEREIEPWLTATAVLADAVVERNEARQLQDIAETARMVFQFSEVVAMVADDQQVLRWIGATNGPHPESVMLRPWQAFSLPISASPRLRDSIAARRPLFIDRERDAAAELSVAEDQLLRLLETDQLICLPLRLRDAKDSDGAAVLVCSGDTALIADLSAKQDFLGAFVARAQALHRRAARRQQETEKLLDKRASSQLDAARDLAHEINNPLAIIQNYLEVLDVKLGTSDALSANEQQDLSGDIALLQQEVARVGRLVHALAAPQAATYVGGVDVNQLVDEVVRLFRTQAEVAGVAISSQAHSARVEPVVERDPLEQVLVNLVKNAVEAMSTSQAAASVRPEGGQIVVSNNGLVNRDGRLWLEINVRDNGPGMPAEMLSQLFSARPADGDEPAPSASAPQAEYGAVRGRGLTIVYRLVQAIGATIQCRSNLGGTSFDILLPCRPLAANKQTSEDR